MNNDSLNSINYHRQWNWQLPLHLQSGTQVLSLVFLGSDWFDQDSIEQQFNKSNRRWSLSFSLFVCVCVCVPGLLSVSVLLNGWNWSGVVHDIFVLHANAFLCTFAKQMDFFDSTNYAYRFYVKCIFAKFCSFFSDSKQIEFHSVVRFGLSDRYRKAHTHILFGSHNLRNFSTYFIECGNKKTGRMAQQRRFVLTAF